MNLFGSHDANRIGSYIVNRGIGSFREWGEYFGLSQALGNPQYNVRKPNKEEFRLQKLLAIMQMTYVGAPFIYYGDEIGMWGANDPCSRKPMIWDDIVYEDEVYLPDQSRRSPDKVERNMDMFAHYQKLIKIRNENRALRLGSYKTLIADDDKNIFVFEREYEGEKFIVAFNNSNSVQTISIPTSEINFSDVLNGGNYNVSKNHVSLDIDGKWAAILKKI
jgi:cyclomaltodextrinase / maltogenic alpha-amylase / neopullulanase